MPPLTVGFGVRTWSGGATCGWLLSRRHGRFLSGATGPPLCPSLLRESRPSRPARGKVALQLCNGSDRLALRVDNQRWACLAALAPLIEPPSGYGGGNMLGHVTSWDV